MGGGESERLFGGDDTYGRHGENLTSSSPQLGSGSGGGGSAASMMIMASVKARRMAMRGGGAMAVVIMLESLREKWRETEEF